MRISNPRQQKRTSISKILSLYIRKMPDTKQISQLEDEIQTQNRLMNHCLYLASNEFLRIIFDHTPRTTHRDFAPCNVFSNIDFKRTGFYQSVKLHRNQDNSVNLYFQ